MKYVNEHSTFKSDFPEEFDWYRFCDSIVGTNTAMDICIEIREDLTTKERIFVPGLRKALNILAEYSKAV